jgi:linoleoyl-CoA desaturase
MSPLSVFPSQRFRFSDGAHDAFTRDLRRRAAKVLDDPRRLRRGGWLMKANAALWAAAFLLGYGTLLTAPANGWACIALAFCAGIAALLLAIGAGHDAAHGAFFESPALNRALAIGSFALLGVDGNLWQRRHNGSHHAFPNVSGCDADIDQNPILRLSPHHPRRPWQRWQVFYAPLAYAVVQVHSIVIGDAIYLFRKRLANIHRAHPSAVDVAIFATTKLAYATLAFILPGALLHRSWWQIAGTWLCVSAVTSLTFIALLIGTHFVEAAGHPTVAPDGTISGSWARHQLVTSLDWNPESRLANWISGGANAHAAHHLFPRVPHVHYPALTPIIRAVAEKHGLPYHRATFIGMVRSHFRFLRQMAEAPPADDGPKAPHW